MGQDENISQMKSTWDEYITVLVFKETSKQKYQTRIFVHQYGLLRAGHILDAVQNLQVL